MAVCEVTILLPPIFWLSNLENCMRRTKLDQPKSILGILCPLLVKYSYCNKTVITQTEKRWPCKNNIDIHYTSMRNG